MLRSHKQHKLTALLIVLLALSFHEGISFAEDIKIEVMSDKVIGKINPLIRGNAMIGYYPRGKDYKGYSNHGAGIWDPEKKRPVTEVVNLAKNIRISILRFPGGQPDYNWKSTIGPSARRPNYLYGIDEFLKTAEEIGSEVIYTFPYYIGTVDDAADLVEYLNAEPDGKNPGGGIDWANERAKNGHPEPYKVKYFELGNEVNFGIPQDGFPAIDPAIYANKYLEYRKAMKAIDPSILLGAVTVNSGQVKGISAWNNRVFEIAGSVIDFLIEHTYRPRVLSDSDEIADINKLFENTMANLGDVGQYYKKLSRHFETVSGRKNIPVAVTEYNGGFGQEKPLPFRHSLGTALLNAGLLQMLMSPENNILMSNYHQFANSHWGMIKNDKFMQGKGQYIKRPNYYTIEMYSNHFGNELLDARVTDNSSNDSSIFNEVDLLLPIAWKREIVFGADIDVGKDGTVKIEFDNDKDINFHHVLKKTSVKPDTAYLLSGYIRAENLQDIEGVCLEIQDGRGWQVRNNETTEKIWGTTDWMRVEMEYTTLNDTSDVYVIIRRLGGRGNINGKVYVRDVKLIEKQTRNVGEIESLMVLASIDKANNNLYIMILNKNISDDISASIKVNKNKLSKEVTAWTLNGPAVWSVNEVDPATVTITKKSVEMNRDKQINYVFPAHSLTSLQFQPMN
jgi:alpha-N-arabinofuranosidase